MVLFAKVVLSTLALLPFFCFYRKTFRTTLYLNVSGNGSQLTFTSENTGTQAHVVTEDESNYNVFTRDYIVNNSDYKAATQIIASSHAVIHLVDHVVDYR